MPVRDSDLMVIVTDANGTTKAIDSDAPDPADRPRGIQFGTQIQSGFYTASFSLRRAIDRDNDDIHLGDDIRFIGANGDTAYEGYVTALPRSTDATGATLDVQTAGWMAHASDEPFTEIFVDRDLSGWGPIGRTRTVSNVAAGRPTVDAGVSPDVTSGATALKLVLEEPYPAAGKFCEALYDSGAGDGISAIYYDYVTTNVNTADATNNLTVGVMDNDALTGLLGTSNLATAASGIAYFSPSTSKRYGLVTFSHASVTTGSTQHLAMMRSLAVYGSHGLTKQGSDPRGFYASDVIKYLAGLYCPLLDTTGVQQTTYPIGQLAFKEPTKPYDAFLKVNSYHLWKLAVWEKRTLTYSQIDLTDWDWEVRHDDVGNQIGLQGDSLDALRNGLIVHYTNVATGLPDRLHPSGYAELRDDSIDNPWTMQGRHGYGEPFTIPFPCTTADALELGRLQLAEDNQPKAPGSFTVAHHILDRAGVPQPVWKVRAGDRIRLTSSANLSDRPRLIQETGYTHDGRGLTISVDSTLRYLEGFLDRTTTALQAAGLAQ